MLVLIPTDRYSGVNYTGGEINSQSIWGQTIKQLKNLRLEADHMKRTMLILLPACLAVCTYACHMKYGLHSY